MLNNKTRTTGSLLLLAFLAVEGWLFFPVLVVLGFATFASTPVLLAVVLESYTESKSTANGIFMAISFALGSMATILVGYAADHLGLKAAFTGSAIVAFIGVPFVFLLAKRSQSN